MLIGFLLFAPILVTAFDCPSEGKHRDPSDCAAYYVCGAGNVNLGRLTCPPGLVWNTGGSYCDWPANVDCSSEPPVTEPPSTGGSGHVTEKPVPTKKPDRPSPSGVPTLEEAAAREEELTSSALFKKVKESIVTLHSSKVDQIAPGKTDNPDNVKRLERLLKESDWDFLFPERNEQYTYRKFLQAVGKFPMICGDYADKDADQICKKTLATMFAHFTQETGGHSSGSSVPEWRQGLIHLTEMGCSQTSSGCGYNTECNPGSWQAQAWPCGKAADGSWMKYYGRGAKQLSYNYNYGPFSDAMFGTVSKLLNDPELVATTWLSLASATWFYAYPQPPKPSMFHVVDGTWQPNAQDKASNLVPGFGVTIMIINGGIECGHGSEKPQAANRIKYYKAFSKYFNLDISGEELSCAHMKAFSAGGAGSLAIYWDKNWGRKYECKLVSYQTPYNALKQGDFGRCVEDKFGVNLN